MTGGSDRERVAEYVAVLRGVGLTASAVAALHGDDELDDGELVERVADEFESADDSELHVALREAIATSPRGVNAPLEYWNHAPEVHLEELLAPYGCSVTVEPARGADALADGALAIRITDAAGRTFWTRFEYPDSDLGTDNYPALLHHVERRLLAGTGLRFVRLAAPPGRWWFAMLTADQLAALRERYGERVEVFGAPLLAAEQPAAFDSSVPPIPPGYAPTFEVHGAEPGPSVERASVDSLATVADDDAPQAGDVDLGLDATDPSDEAIVESVQDGGGGAASTAAVSGGDAVAASDDDLEAVLGDLSDVSLDPDAADGNAPAGPTDGETGTDGAGAEAGIDGRGSDETVALDVDPAPDEETAEGVIVDEDATDEERAEGEGAIEEGADGDPPDALDDLFEEIKRDVAGSVPTTGADVSERDEPSVSDLVSGSAADDGETADGSTAEGASAGEHATDGTSTEGTGGEPPGDDVPQDAADLTASELFGTLDEE